MPQSPPELIATFEGLDWTPEIVQVFRGDAWPTDTRVSAVTCILYSGSDLVLVDVATRGWDIPGGHTNEGESPYDTLERELLEEVGARAFEYSRPVLLGWLRVGGVAPRILPCFTANLVTVRPLTTQVPDEIRAVRLFSPTDLPPEVPARVWYPLLK